MNGQLGQQVCSRHTLFFGCPRVLHFSASMLSSPMESLSSVGATPSVLCHTRVTTRKNYRQSKLPAIRTTADEETQTRRAVICTIATAFAIAGLPAIPVALAENWGTRSFLKERFFQPEISPEDAAARIRQTAQGLHSMRSMLDTMSWRYVIFYIRLKSAYLSSDLKNAFSTVPEIRRKSYIQTANELIDNMAELDNYVRTPKVYESYLYYEKTLKSLDELVALLA